MKSLICSLVIMVSALISKAQTTYPVVSPFGGPVTKSTIPNYGAIQGGLIPLKFADTTAANTALSYGKNYDGFLIFTSSPPALWWRYYTDSTKWVQILPSGSSGGTLAWVMGGNNPVVTDVSLYGLLGPKTNNGLSFITNNTVKFSVNVNGAWGIGSARDFGSSGNILQSNGSGSAPSWVSTSGLSGWSLTGNAGTTAGTNFIGTTDNVDFVFKRSNVESGRISTGNASFGYQALMNNSGSNSNTAFGVSALLNTTTGVDNTAVGVSALSSAITADFNTAVGSLSAGNTTGSENTAIGFQSLGINDVGTNNISVGAYAGANVQTLSNRVYINSINRGSDQFDTTKSIIYGAQDATASSQRLYLNSQVYMPYINSGAGTKALRINPGTGIITYADTSTASGTVTGTGTANQDAYWTSTTAIGGSALKTFDPTSNFSQMIKGANGGGIKVGGYNATIGGIWSAAITPSTANYFIGGDANNTYINAPAGAIYFSLGDVAKWLINSSGHFLASTDNSYDIGASGATRPRDFFLGRNATIGGTLGVTGTSSFTGTTTHANIIDNGTLKFANASYMYWDTRSTIESPSDGVLRFENNAGTSFTAINLGTNTASSPAIRVNGTGIDIKLADNSAYTNLTALTLTGNTSVKSPLLIGGTGTTSTLTYKTTTGVGTTGADHIFQVGNNGATEAMRILNSGNVGIGTSTPATNMEVYVTANAGGIRATSNGTASPLLGLYNGSTEEGGIGWAQSANRFASGAGAGDIVVYAYDAGGTHKLNFATGSSPTVRMTIDGNGNVGIGTTSPNSTLHTNGSFATAYRAITALRTLDGTDYTIEVTANTFTVTLPTAVGITGRIYVITNSGSGVTTVGTTSSQTFANVLTTPTTLSLAQYSTVMVQSNGANWLRLTNL